MSQVVRWGLQTPEYDFDQLARLVYRPDVWREAAAALGLNCPLADEKTEGGQAARWQIAAIPHNIIMPANQLFDGGVFRCTPVKQSSDQPHQPAALFVAGLNVAYGATSSVRL
jgi:hypothetical protein